MGFETFQKSGIFIGAALLAWTSAAHAADEDYLLKPYLFRSATDTVNVGWKYAQPSDRTPSVELLQGRRSLRTVEARDDGGFLVAPLPLPSCGFGSNYFYRISKTDTPHPISDIPCSEAQTVRFTFLADTHRGTELTRQFAQEIGRFPGNFVIHGGDFVQKGADEAEWTESLNALSPATQSRVLFPVLGNHEYRGREDAEPLPWERYFQTSEREANYVLESGPVRFLVLNSNFEQSTVSADQQADWLRGQLAVPARWKVVIFHHPPYSNGIGHRKLPFLTKEHEVIQEKFVPLFVENGVQLVLNGHTHLYEYSEKAGVQYVTTGPAGGRPGKVGSSNPYTERSFFARTIIHVEANQQLLHVMSVDEAGKTVDDFVRYQTGPKH